jgi:hypothetical protein
MTWGDNGSARPTTKEYGDGWDRIFKKKSKAMETRQETSQNTRGVPPEGSEEGSRVRDGGSASRADDRGDD